MYNEKIEALISAALADGVLTEKEKQILFKNAQAQGIDLDEFEMVLDARLVELQKAEQEKVEKSAPKSTKFGDVRKCPACGAIVAVGNAACTECGYAFSEECGSNVIDKLYERLSAIDDKYGKMSMNVKSALTGVVPEVTKSKEKINAITVFNVPNTRPELLGLLTSIEALADPKAPKNGWGLTSENLGYGYWLLYVNCINKAKISFAKDSSFAPYFAKYEEMLAESKKFHLSPRAKLVVGYIGLMIVLGLIGLIASLCMTGSYEEELERDEAMRDKFAEYISSGDAVNAKATLQKIGTDNYDEALELIELYAANGDVNGAVSVYEKLTPGHCAAHEMLRSENRNGSNNNYELDATKLIRREATKLGDYDLVWEYSERTHSDPNSHYNADKYFRFMTEVVMYLCKEGKNQDARAFVKQYSVWFVNNVDNLDYTSQYDDYNSKKSISKLNQIINNY